MQTIMPQGAKAVLTVNKKPTPLLPKFDLLRTLNTLCFTEPENLDEAEKIRLLDPEPEDVLFCYFQLLLLAWNVYAFYKAASSQRKLQPIKPK